MAIISGTTVAWYLSPRIITIPVAQTEITIEDLQDTLQALEESEEGMVWKHLRNTSGGESLGGGTTVGYTMELQNAQVSFVARTTPLESGTITTGGTTTLTDSTATFQTNNVGLGDLVMNVTDGSQATVISVTSETDLTCTSLTGGTDNDFDITDVYRVYDIVQCRVTGGNLVAVDNLGAEISPIFPTFGTQVLATASSSATTANLISLNFATYNGGIYIDTVNGVSGTGGVLGNEANPVNNLTDAKSIATTLGFTRLYFTENASTIGASDNISSYLVEGVYHDRSVLTLTTGCTITDAQFNNLAIQGDAGTDFCVLENCSLRTISNFNGNVYRSEIGGTIGLNLGAFRHWINCVSNQNTGTPVLDFQSITQNLIISNYVGDIIIRNFTGGSLELFCNAAQVEIESNCTGGTISLYGTIGLTNNSAGAMVDVSNAVVGKMTQDLWHFKGCDPANPAVISGDGVTSSIVEVGGKTLTILPDSITRT